MKDKKTIGIALAAMIVAAGAVYFFVTNKSNGDNGGNSDNTSQESTKGNCKIFDCMKQLNGKMTVEEVNKVIGFDGEKTSETDSYVVYNWDLSDKIGITGQFHTKYGTATISANYPSDMASNKADFSKWSDIQAKLKSKESLTYDQFVEMVGGVEGAVKQITDSSTSYSWYNADGGYLSGYFDKDGKCTMATGRF